MVIDASAAVAIFLGEPDAPSLRLAIEQDLRRLLSAATLVEMGIVVEARAGAAGGHFVDRFLRDTEAEVVPVDREAVVLAMEGWRRFGRGNHQARLNFGNCFTYALAAQSGEPVLCTGEDFARTDVAVVPLAGKPS